MYLYYAIGFSGMGVFWLLSYFAGEGASVFSLIAGILCLVLGSYNGRKYMENREK